MTNVDREFDEAVRYNKTQTPEPQKRVTSMPGAGFDDSFLEIFNSPEYKRRQEELRRRDQAQYQQQQPQQPKVKVTNVNHRRLKKKEKFSLKKGVIVIVTIVMLGCLTKLFIPAHAPENKPSMIVPDGYISMVTSEEVVRGDTVYSIADEYYDANVYSNTYGSLSDYVEMIIDTNNLNYKGDIEPFDVLTIPVLVDVDNEHYQELRRIEQEIAQIREEEYWVDYVVKAGDSLSSIAAKASGTNAETIELTKRIMSKNDLDSSFIYIGQHLKIVNPILGDLKMQFNEAKEALQESLKDNGNTMAR